MTHSAQIFVDLMKTIEDRKENPPERSYTTSLFAGGAEKIGEKILEEAAEVVEASQSADSSVNRAHLTHEASDLIYHLFVMLGYRGISLDDLTEELSRRFGTSGLDEKESRDA